MLFGSDYLLESFFFFTALFFEVGKFLEALFFVLWLLGLRFEPYLGYLVVFVSYLLEDFLVGGDSICEYRLFVFIIAVAMNRKQDIIVVIRRYFNLLERAIVALQVFEVTLLLNHHGFPDFHVVITEDLGLNRDGQLWETLEGVTPMNLANLETVALGGGLVDEHGSSVERHVMRPDYELVSESQLEKLLLIDFEPQIDATSLEENDLVNKV